MSNFLILLIKYIDINNENNVTDIYKVGGAQAIAAMAYGTNTISWYPYASYGSGAQGAFNDGIKNKGRPSGARSNLSQPCC